ncbi:MAG: right-handed parallel beta-helix repeat-containing protein [Treponemataceae bacterium]|nr:right-handed parallel beta-helix repeat-containing protein [Treponemataceae bacterium]
MRKSHFKNSPRNYGGGYGEVENSESGSLTVTARVSNGSSRYAMPSMPELVYAALLYKDDESSANENFVEGEVDGDKLKFSFQKPDDMSGTFTLEIFAFAKKTDDEEGTADFSKDKALLSGSKTGLSIVGDTIEIDGTIALAISSTEPGTVSLKIKVPDGCSLEIKELKSDGTAESDVHFAITGTSPNFTVTQKDANGISSGAYQVTFTVKKGAEIIHIFSEYINVINGFCTDTWSGAEKGAAKEITPGMISSTVYVRGSGGYYDTSPYNATAVANDGNSGSLLSPLETIQKAIDKIIAINDGTSAYTIYVDGTLNGTTATAGANGMADFSKLSKNLNLTIKALSVTATLDGGARFDSKGTATAEGIEKRVIYVYPKSGILNLTLENLTITGGNTKNSSGGGIYFYSAGGTLKISDGTTISGNKASAYGGGVCVIGSESRFTMTGGTISDCTATDRGGGVYISSNGTFEMSGTANITGCKTTSTSSSTAGGGGIYNTGTLNIIGGTISDCISASRGGGVFVTGSESRFTMTAGTISDCKAERQGGGVYVVNGGTFEMSGTAKITGCKTTSISSSEGGGVYVDNGAFTMTGDTISDCTATKRGGGVYVVNGGTFEMSGTAKITGCKTTSISSSEGGGVYVDNGAFTMTGDTISDCTATKRGGGVYVVNGGTFEMSGTAKITGCKTTSASGSEGGGVFVTGSESTFKMSGSASIPAEDDGKNDVYLYASGTDIPTITVAGDLTASSPVATITPSAYTAGRQVLSAGTDMTIDDTVCGKFAVSQKGWEIAPNDDGTAGVLGISIYLDSSSGDDANSGLTASKAVKTLSKAIELFESQGAQKIMVCAEYTLPSEESTLLDRAGKEHLTLMRYIGKSDVSGAFLGKLLTISRGNVTITNVTLDGTIKGYRTDCLLSISGSGTEVTLGDDAVICNNSDSGVCVSSYNGKFKMTGGAITGNRTYFYGAGVKISYGTFEMSGGIISGNDGGSYGGGVDVGTNSGCKFTMSGGEISGNRAQLGAGISVSKGLYTGTFEMSGGTISENQSYGTGDDAGGGGVYVSGKFTMSGGEITGNTAKSQGGGVFVKTGGTFTPGGTVSGNTPDEVYEQP